jgi:hypothetical protein
MFLICILEHVFLIIILALKYVIKSKPKWVVRFHARRKERKNERRRRRGRLLVKKELKVKQE